MVDALMSSAAISSSSPTPDPLAGIYPTARVGDLVEVAVGALNLTVLQYYTPVKMLAIGKVLMRKQQ